MITLFTLPKPFTEPHIRLIQRNALKSWKLLHSDIEIIVLGTDAGIAETCQELGLIHIPEVLTTEYGTPRLDSAFELVRSRARPSHDILMFANADMVLTDDFIPVLEHLPVGPFLACGRRWDLDVKQEINFSNTDWAAIIRNQAHVSGKLHSAAGMDYFIFRKDSFRDMPALVVGRIGWDNWMIWYSKKHTIPVINITGAVTAVHQNHGYPGYNKGVERKTNPEAKQNLSFIPATLEEMTSDGATLNMMPDHSLQKNRGLVLQQVKKFARRFIRT